MHQRFVLDGSASFLDVAPGKLLGIDPRYRLDERAGGGTDYFHALLKEEVVAKSAKRLGRGLDSLVPDLRLTQDQGKRPATKRNEPARHVPAPAEPAVSSPVGSPVAQETQAMMIPVGELHPNPYQPRGNASDSNVASLARSIASGGLIQPISARLRDGRYEIIAGQRRWQAARSLGMERIAVMVRGASDEQMLELALIENIQREDLNAIDRARAYRRFCDRFNLKPEEVANRLGEDRTTVVNYLRLLELPDAIQDLVADESLSMGHARCLAGVADEVRRGRLAEMVVENDLSVRALEEIVRRERRGGRQEPQPEGSGSRLLSAHLVDLQRRFEEAVKTRVIIKEARRKGTGRVIIEYYSLDDFDRICGLLGVEGEEREG